MDVAAFGGKVQEYLRGSGYTQKDLASALSLHPKVLSRKLHGNEDARLTHVEVRRIITTLASLQAIATQDEVIQLLELAQMQPSSFSADEWQSPPLSQLVAKKSVQSLFSPSLLGIPCPRSPLAGTIYPHRSPGSLDENGRWSGCGGCWDATKCDWSRSLGRGGVAKRAWL